MEKFPRRIRKPRYLSKRFLEGLGSGIIGVLGFLGLADRIFNRTPQRTIPTEDNAVVSPANGTIIHIETATDTLIRFFKKGIENRVTIDGLSPPYRVVVIALDLLDVHAQRSPLAGEVVDQKYFPGRFDNALYVDDPASLSYENEKMLTVIRGQEITLGVVQVAGLFARRIHSLVEVGQSVERGQLIGRITLGSQAVLILPETCTLCVHIGQKVIDGETLIATTPKTSKVPAGR